MEKSWFGLPTIMRIRKEPCRKGWRAKFKVGPLRELTNSYLKALQSDLELLQREVNWPFEVLHSQKKQLSQLYSFISVSLELPLYSWISGLDDYIHVEWAVSSESVNPLLHTTIILQHSSNCSFKGWPIGLSWRGADLALFEELFYWLSWESQKIDSLEGVLRYFSLGF